MVVDGDNKDLSVIRLQEGAVIMPKVGGRKYPYTQAGKAAAKKAATSVKKATKKRNMR